MKRRPAEPGPIQHVGNLPEVVEAVDQSRGSAGPSTQGGFVALIGEMALPRHPLDLETGGHGHPPLALPATEGG